MWTFQLDARRARHPRAIDPLDVSAAFMPGRGALALMALISDAFQGDIPPAVRPWVLGGRLIALKKDDETGIFAPDEHDTILRFCVGAKVKHLLRNPPPGTAADAFHRLHNDLLDSHLNVSPPSVDQHHTAQTFQLTSPHFDARGVAALPLGLGGHGFTPFSHPPPPPSASNSLLHQP